MKIDKYMIFILAAILLAGMTPAAAGEDQDTQDSKIGVDMESLGGGDYLSGDGGMIHMESLGGQDYWNDDGGITQMDDLGWGTYITDDGDIIQKDGDEK